MIRAAAFLLCSLMVTGCGGSPSGPSNEGPLRLSADISAGLVLPGSEAILTFTLQNLTSETIRLTFSSSCQISPFILRRDAGQVVYPPGGGWACLQVLTSLELAPRASVTREVRVSGGDVAQAGAVALAPGDYAAYARLEDRTMRLQSEPVGFTVQ
jgi:hypothetical protein